MNKKGLGTLLSLMLLASPTWADEAVSPSTEVAINATIAAVNSAQGTIKQEALVKIAQQGFDAVNTIQQAREDLFEGMIDESQKLLESANNLLKSDSIEWALYTKTPTKTQDIKGKEILKDEQYIIINSSLTLAEDFIPNDEQQMKLQEAGKKFNDGDEKGGIEAFQSANVTLNEMIILLPLKSAQAALETARNQYKNKQYFEANLTLKGIVESLVADSITVVEANQ